MAAQVHPISSAAAELPPRSMRLVHVAIEVPETVALWIEAQAEWAGTTPAQVVEVLLTQAAWFGTHRKAS